MDVQALIKELGPMKYSYNTRIGNWSEEWELEESKKKDYLARKDMGQLTTTKHIQSIQYSNQRASVTFSKSGCLSFGDRVQLCNKATQSLLACNIEERIMGVQEGYNAVGTQNQNPTIRSVFILQRAEKDFFTDNFIHYGQKVRVCINPRLTDKPLLLHSAHISPQCQARKSRQQQACFMLDKTVNTVWEIEHINPKFRFESYGEPVRANDQILLKHAFTCQWLASDPLYNFKIDGGQEYEVFGHSYQNFNKTQNLIAEKMGRNTTDIPLRGQHDQNVWSFRSASSPQMDFDESTLDQPKTAKDLLGEIRQTLCNRGSYGIRGLARIFLAMDTDGNRTLEFDDFRWGLKNYGLVFNNQETKELFKFFDQNSNGNIDFNEFMTTIRGTVNQNRMNCIAQAWAKVSCGNQTITLEQLVIAYNSQKHPAVIKGYQTPQEVFNEFVKMWDKDADGIVTQQEFCEYFKDISAATDDDDYFCQTLKNVFSL